jgi:hypothetical protein
MNFFHEIIDPVLRSIPESHLRTELIRSFSLNAHHFDTIETGFRALTSRRQTPERLRCFFQSWSQTNNSAMTVAGIGNRLTLLLHRGREIADEPELLRTLTSLNRIVDEDLAVTHKVLHSEIFYRMATGIVGDDLWLSQGYLHPAAKDFKAWKDHNSLRDPDIFVALLTTLTHEIYTHGEVEFILPLFTRWLREENDMPEAECRRTLAWIHVHCGPTEKDHFFHALDAIHHFSRAMDVNIDDYLLGEIVETYLEKKAGVLEQVCLRAMAEVEAVI